MTSIFRNHTFEITTQIYETFKSEVLQSQTVYQYKLNLQFKVPDKCIKSIQF